MTTSRYDCAKVNPNFVGNFVGVEPKSAISVRLCPLRHGVVSNASETEHLKRLPDAYDHCAVTAAVMHVIFHIHTDKYTDHITD